MKASHQLMRTQTIKSKTLGTKETQETGTEKKLGEEQRENAKLENSSK
jgi:hypothetical protein